MAEGAILHCTEAISGNGLHMLHLSMEYGYVGCMLGRKQVNLVELSMPDLTPILIIIQPHHLLLLQPQIQILSSLVL